MTANVTEPVRADSGATIQESTLQLPVTSRCDRCDAQAWVEVAVRGSRLLFCAHHYLQHQDALLLTPVQIVDHRPALQALEESKLKDNRR